MTASNYGMRDLRLNRHFPLKIANSMYQGIVPTSFAFNIGPANIAINRQDDDIQIVIQ